MANNNFLGMDPDIIKGQIVPQLSSQADELQQVSSAVDKLMATAEQAWNGPDSQKFRAEWEGTHRKTLQTLTEQLRSLSRTAAQNAEAQLQTSAN